MYTLPSMDCFKVNLMLSEISTDDLGVKDAQFVVNSKSRTQPAYHCQIIVRQLNTFDINWIDNFTHPAPYTRLQ